MGRRFFCLLAVLCLALLGFASMGIEAAQVVNGTLISWAQDTVYVKVDGTGKTMSIRPAAGATIMRGQMDREVKKAALLDFAPGDRIVAVVDQSGRASSIKAFYAVAKGTLARVQGDKLFFRDGTSVLLRPGLQVVFGDGKMGRPADLKPGTVLVCRMNPATREAWTVVATEPAVTPPAKTPEATVTPALESGKTPGSEAPEITSVTYVAPSPLNVRDWMRVDLLGTPGGRATCQVKGLIPVTVMKEISPGSYRASVMVPGGKPVTNAPVVGRLVVDGAEAAPVQASRLITVDPETQPVVVKLPEPGGAAEPGGPVVAIAETEMHPEPEPEPEIAVVKAPEPAPMPEPVVEAPKPEPPREKALVVLTAPVNQARLQRTLLVSGTAEPGASVMVTISYTNGLSGLLALSGQVSSQLVAVAGNGQFRMGPIALEGPLATRGLIFTVKAHYPGVPEVAATVSALGDRS